jgi:SAM-dependent methyltransferase
MSSYLGRHAQLYDIFYSEKNYQQEANFVHQLIKEFGRKPSKQILELACGTGNHAFLLEKCGYELHALDYSSDMIARAKEKAKESNSTTCFQVGDMRNLAFQNEFDAAICLFDSIGYVLTNEAIHAVFNKVYQSLRAEGVFIFEFWHAPAMLKNFDPVRVKRWRLADREILRISETTIDIPSSTSTVHYSIYELFSDGTFSHLSEVQRNRFFQLQEMLAFVESNGFKMKALFGGYHKDLTIVDAQTWHIVMLVQK